MGKTRISPEDIGTILELGEKGWTAGRIAGRLDHLSQNSIHYHLLKHGLVRPPKFCRPDYMRKGRLVMGFTAEEDAALEQLSLSGLNDVQVGIEMGRRFPGRERRANSVCARLRQLACNEASKEEA